VVALAAEQGADIAGAALIAATDVEYGRRRGKALGDRNVTGNLSGLFRVKSDLAGHRPERSGWSTATSAPNWSRSLLSANGDEHAVYRDALARLTDND